MDDFCTALFQECDKRNGSEDVLFSDHAAVTALLPLLLTSLDHEHKSEITTRIQANAISAVSGYNLSEDSFLYHVTPRNPFPSDTVSILINTLEAFEYSSALWVQNTSVLLYQVTREATHGRRLLSELEVTRVVGLVQSHGVAAEEVASNLFWILTSLVLDSVSRGDSHTMPVAITYCWYLGCAARVLREVWAFPC